MSTLLTRNVNDILVIYIVDTSLVDLSRIESLTSELSKLALDGVSTKLVLNLQNVKFMSSTMIGKLVLFAKKCKSAKAKLRVCGANKDLGKAFQLMALDKEMNIDPDEPASLAAFK